VDNNNPAAMTMLYDANKKSLMVAYLLWFFLGVFAAHRFYLGRPLSAILQILSYFILIGFLWWVIDFFLLPGMIARENDNLRYRLGAAFAR